MRNTAAGFTLMEMLVTISVVVILAGALYFNFLEGTAQSRNAERKADLVTMQNAIERYKLDHGRYPAGCNGTAWSGEIGSTHECASGNNYIVGHDASINFAPKYIPVLPSDPAPQGGDHGYVYRTNADGSVYKLVSWNTWEGDPFIDWGYDLQACDVVLDTVNFPGDGFKSSCPSAAGIPAEGGDCSLGMCNYFRRTVVNAWDDPNDVQNECGTDTFDSLAVWGGYTSLAYPGSSPEGRIEYGTERVVCDMP